MLVAREYRSLDDVRIALGGRLDRAHQPSLFHRLEWMQSLHAHCFAGEPVRVITATDGGAEAWLFLRTPDERRLSALANWYSFSWAPIYLGAPDAASRGRLMEAIARHLLRHGAQIDFYPVDEEAELLLGAFRRAGWFAVQRPMGGRYLLPVGGRDFAAYWAARPGQLRTLARRKERGTPFEIGIADQLTDDLWHDYVAVQNASWKGPEPGLPFLRAMAERESAAGALRLGFARADGRAVATQLWTIENGTALIHKLAHDRAFDDASPGTLLSKAMFAHAIDTDRVELIDYGTGDNPYKTDWMETRRTLHRIDCFNPKMASLWIPAVKTVISALVG